jgi:hypothetical protein
MSVPKIVFASSYTLPALAGTTIYGCFEKFGNIAYSSRRFFKESGHRANGEYYIQGGLEPYDITVEGWFGQHNSNASAVTLYQRSILSGVTSSGIHSLQLKMDNTVIAKYNVFREKPIEFYNDTGYGMTRYKITFRNPSGTKVI